MHRAILAARQDAGGGLRLITLEIEPHVASTYTAPGQYIEVVTSSGKGYFVLGGAAGAPAWELLIRNAGGAADFLETAPIGSALEASAALGAGFPVARTHGRHLVVATVGSALAVARPMLSMRVGSGDARATHVYVGARGAGDVPLIREVERWARAGAEVVLCLSRGQLDHEDDALRWARLEHGYVQDVVARDVATGRVPAALVFAAGPAGMLTAMRGLPGSVLEVVTNV